MRGVGEEVAAQRLYVHRHVGDGLRGIDDGDDAARFGAGDERREVVDGTECVGDERGGEDFDAVEQVVEVRGVERAVVVDGDDGEFGAEALAGALPRHDVGVVFERGQQHAVARFEDEFAQGACQQVECFGGAFGVDDFFGARGVDEAGGLRAHGVVAGAQLLGEVVHAAVDVAVVVAVAVVHCFDDRQRFLRAGGVVEVGQRFAVDGAAEDGEFVLHAAASSSPSQMSLMVWWTASARVWCSTTTASCRKLRMSILRAAS